MSLRFTHKIFWTTEIANLFAFLDVCSRKNYTKPTDLIIIDFQWKTMDARACKGISPAEARAASLLVDVKTRRSKGDNRVKARSSFCAHNNLSFSPPSQTHITCLSSKSFIFTQNESSYYFFFTNRSFLMRFPNFSKDRAYFHLGHIAVL